MSHFCSATILSLSLSLYIYIYIVLDMTHKQSDGEVPVMLGFLGIRSTPSLPLLPGPLWPGEVAPDRALSMG